MDRRRGSRHPQNQRRRRTRVIKVGRASSFPIGEEPFFKRPPDVIIHPRAKKTEQQRTGQEALTEEGKFPRYATKRRGRFVCTTPRGRLKPSFPLHGPHVVSFSFPRGPFAAPRAVRTADRGRRERAPFVFSSSFPLKQQRAREVLLMLFLLLLSFWFSVFQRSPRGKEGGIFAPCGKNLPCVVVFSQIRLKLPTSFSKKPFLFRSRTLFNVVYNTRCWILRLSYIESEMGLRHVLTVLSKK